MLVHHLDSHGYGENTEHNAVSYLKRVPIHDSSVPNSGSQGKLLIPPLPHQPLGISKHYH